MCPATVLEWYTHLCIKNMLCKYITSLSLPIKIHSDQQRSVRTIKDFGLIVGYGISTAYDIYFISLFSRNYWIQVLSTISIQIKRLRVKIGIQLQDKIPRMERKGKEGNSKINAHVKISDLCTNPTEKFQDMCIERLERKE